MDIINSGFFDAFTIYDSDLPLEKKISLWEKIINEKPDEIIDYANWYYEEKSLHGFLKKCIGIKKRLLKEFSASDNNTVFTYCEAIDDDYYSICCDDYYVESIFVFRTFEECVKKAAEKNCDEIVIYKKYFNASMPLKARASADGNILDVFSFFPPSDDEEFILYDAFPTLKRLIIKEADYYEADYYCDLPF